MTILIKNFTVLMFGILMVPFFAHADTSTAQLCTALRALVGSFPSPSTELRSSVDAMCPPPAVVTTGSAAERCTLATAIANADVTLYEGMQKTETKNMLVNKLQKFLNLSGSPVAISGSGSLGNETYHFGGGTEDAVQDWQAKNGVVTSGSPETTGYGQVGKNTRTKMVAVACGGASTNTTTTENTTTNTPNTTTTSACTSTQEGTYGTGCRICTATGELASPTAGQECTAPVLTLQYYPSTHSLYWGVVRPQGSTCTASGLWSGTKESSGEYALTTNTGTYGLTCAGAGTKTIVLTSQNVTGTEVVTAGVGGSTDTTSTGTGPAPRFMFNLANNSGDQTATTARVRWYSLTNGTTEDTPVSCTASGDWSGAKTIIRNGQGGASATISYAVITRTTTEKNLILTCLSASGVPTVKSVTVSALASGTGTEETGGETSTGSGDAFGTRACTTGYTNAETNSYGLGCRICIDGGGVAKLDSNGQPTADSCAKPYTLFYPDWTTSVFPRLDLVWKSDRTSSCRVTGPSFSESGLHGRKRITALENDPKIYTLNCSGSGVNSSVVDTKTVTIPAICSEEMGHIGIGTEASNYRTSLCGDRITTPPPSGTSFAITNISSDSTATNATRCSIASGQNHCNMNIYWSASGLTSVKYAISAAGETPSSGFSDTHVSNSGNMRQGFGPGSHRITLRGYFGTGSSYIQANKEFTAECVTGTTWNASTGTCKEPGTTSQTPTLTLSANPTSCVIQKDQSECMVTVTANATGPITSMAYYTEYPQRDSGQIVKSGDQQIALFSGNKNFNFNVTRRSTRVYFKGFYGSGSTNIQADIPLTAECDSGTTWNASQDSCKETVTTSTTPAAPTIGVSPVTAGLDDSVTFYWNGVGASRFYLLKIDSVVLPNTVSNESWSGTMRAIGFSAGEHRAYVKICTSQAVSSCSGEWSSAVVFNTTAPTAARSVSINAYPSAVVKNTTGMTLGYTATGFTNPSCLIYLNNMTTPLPGAINLASHEWPPFGAQTNSSLIKVKCSEIISGDSAEAQKKYSVCETAVVNGACSGGEVPLPTASANAVSPFASLGNGAYSQTVGASQMTTNDKSLVLTEDLYRGTTGEEVVILQKALARLGLFSGEITGNFYDTTLEAVRAFQIKYGIKASGYVGGATRTVLNSL